jgi:hypothetical protein
MARILLFVRFLTTALPIRTGTENAIRTSVGASSADTKLTDIIPASVALGPRTRLLNVIWSLIAPILTLLVGLLTFFWLSAFCSEEYVFLPLSPSCV